MEYIYFHDSTNKLLCEVFGIEYHPIESYAIACEPITDNRIPPSNIGIDIGVIGKAPWNKGKKTGPLSEENKKALSIAAKRYTKTEEHKQNLSKALQGNTNGKNNTGTKSEAHRQKLREASLRQWAAKKRLPRIPKPV
jgi:hypothetical protein